MLKGLTSKLNNWLQRNTIVRNLEFFQDFIIISLCLGLFCVMLIRLGDMFFSFLHPLDLRQVTSDILFILILVELFRLLIDHLQQQRTSVTAAVEITIVSALREVILRGVLEISRDQIFGIAIFLLVLTGIMVALPWISRFLEQVTTIAIFVAVIFGQFEAGLARPYDAVKAVLNMHTLLGWSLSGIIAAITAWRYVLRTRNPEKLPIHYMVAGLFLTLIVGLQVYLGDELVWVYGLHTVPVVEALKNGILR